MALTRPFGLYQELVPMMIFVQWMASSRLRRMMLTCLLTVAALLATPRSGSIRSGTIAGRFRSLRPRGQARSGRRQRSDLDGLGHHRC